MRPTANDRRPEPTGRRPAPAAASEGAGARSRTGRAPSHGVRPTRDLWPFQHRRSLRDHRTMSEADERTAPPGRVIALVVGCLLLVPAMGALVGGGGLGLGYAFGRDSSGFFGTSLDRIESPTPAVTAEEIDFTADPGTPGWVIDALDADIRLRVPNASAEREV